MSASGKRAWVGFCVGLAIGVLAAEGARYAAGRWWRPGSRVKAPAAAQEAAVEAPAKPKPSLESRIRIAATEAEAQPPVFVLNETNSATMAGRDDRDNERWLDLACNVYSTEFARRFSYFETGKSNPVVRVRYDATGPTFRGRLEARGLKPNFAYQIKLRGDYQKDKAGFEAIGYAGRWRFPGRETNYSDEDYRDRGDPVGVESYLLFDFFVTDRNGCAMKDFALANTLHVLFDGRYQGIPELWDSAMRRVVVDASDPAWYAKPKPDPTVHYIWAQAETMPGRADIGAVRLPPQHYEAQLVLTEESFHAYGDGGFWATVMEMPVSFTIGSPAAPASPVQETAGAAP